MTINVNNKRFAQILGIMLETGLIWYKHYYLWCDEVIKQFDNPPHWIIELAAVKYLPRAVEIVKKYAYSEPIERYEDICSNQYIACLFLRFDRREISWATFLKEAGDCLDGIDGEVLCEYFYNLLNRYGDSDYSTDIEATQKTCIQNSYQSTINEILEYNNFFKPYYRRFLNQG